MEFIGRRTFLSVVMLGSNLGSKLLKFVPRRYAESSEDVFIAPLGEKMATPEAPAPLFGVGSANLGVFFEWKPRLWFPESEITRFDAAAWVGQIKDAGFDYLLPETKDEEGLAFYPTKSSSWHTSRDYIGEIIRQAGKEKVIAMPYYCVGEDRLAGTTHPDWVSIDLSGKPVSLYDQFLRPSLASPYAEFALSQIKEIVDQFSDTAPGIWLDDVDAYDSRSLFLRQAFEKQYRKPLESATDDEYWAVAGDILVNFVDKARQITKASNPRAQFTANWTASYLVLPNGPKRRARERVGQLIDWLTIEAHQPDIQSSWCKLLRQTGRPFEITSPGDIGWVEYIMKPDPLLQLETAIVLSQGGNLTLSCNPLDSGVLCKEDTDKLATAGQWAAKRKEYLRRTESLADVGVWCGPLLPPEEVWPELDSWQKPTGESQELPTRNTVANGLEDAMREAHIPYALLPPGASFAHHQVLVLQDNVELDEETAQSIRNFVLQGGNILAEGHASLIDPQGRKRTNFLLADVLGVDFAGYSPHVDANYIGGLEAPSEDDDRTAPVLVEGGALQVKLTTARKVAPLIYPARNAKIYKTWTEHNSPDKATAYPAVTINKFGKGEATYVAMPLGWHISRREGAESSTKRLAARLLRKIIPDPLMQTTAPPAVEVVFNRQGSRYIIHFLNFYGWTRQLSEAFPVLGSAILEINARRLPELKKAYLAPERQPLPLTRHGDMWELKLPQLDPIDTMLVLESS
jgi:hypothetical protein